jgi:hypothetical protein
MKINRSAELRAIARDRIRRDASSSLARCVSELLASRRDGTGEKGAFSIRIIGGREETRLELRRFHLRGYASRKMRAMFAVSRINLDAVFPTCGSVVRDYIVRKSRDCESFARSINNG